MLDVLRKRKRSWVVTLLLGVIVIVFVAFYGGRNMREPGAEKVAEVNGETVGGNEAQNSALHLLASSSCTDARAAKRARSAG